jgi:CRP-like cAMP-binding protein
MANPQNLQNYSLFSFLEDGQINKIYSMMQHESYAPGDNIISEGQSNDCIRFIVSGQVAVVKENIILSEFSEGDVFGEIEVLDTLPSEATIKALAPTEVMALSNQNLKEIRKNDPAVFTLILMNLARDLCCRLRRMDIKFTDRWE